mmetsp:Transcript_4942/g.12915  ORF Transcript_4942/g.12915 Transcript_4942/m.12915 type:complete len:231 (-) Transcript_4942:1125-1817(-)
MCVSIDVCLDSLGGAASDFGVVLGFVDFDLLLLRRVAFAAPPRFLRCGRAAGTAVRARSALRFSARSRRPSSRRPSASRSSSSSSSAAAFSSFSFSKEMPFEPNETSTHAGLAKKLYSATASKSRLAFASFSESTTTLTRCGVRQSANQDERGGIGRVSVTVCKSPGTIMGMTVSVALVPKSTLTALTLKGDSVIASPRFSTDTVTFIVSGSSACSADTECGITTLFHSG